MNELQQKHFAEHVISMVRTGKWKALNNERSRSIYKWLCNNLANRKNKLACDLISNELKDSVPLDIKIAMKRESSHSYTHVSFGDDLGIIVSIGSDSAQVLLTSEFEKGNYNPQIVPLEQLQYISHSLSEFDIGDQVRSFANEQNGIIIGIAAIDSGYGLLYAVRNENGVISHVSSENITLLNQKLQKGTRFIHLTYGYTGTVEGYTNSNDASGKVLAKVDGTDYVSKFEDFELKAIDPGTSVTFQQVFDRFKNQGKGIDAKVGDEYQFFSKKTFLFNLKTGEILKTVDSDTTTIYQRYMRFLYVKAKSDENNGYENLELVVQNLNGEVLTIQGLQLQLVLGSELSQIQPLFDELAYPEGFEKNRQSKFSIGQPVVVMKRVNIPEKFRGLKCIVESINGDGTVSLSCLNHRFTISENSVNVDDNASNFLGQKALYPIKPHSSIHSIYDVISYKGNGYYELKNNYKTINADSSLIKVVTPEISKEIEGQKTYEIGSFYYYLTQKKYGKQHPVLVKIIDYSYDVDYVIIVNPIVQVVGADKEPFSVDNGESLVDAGNLETSSVVFMRHDNGNGIKVDLSKGFEHGGVKNVFEALDKNTLSLSDEAMVEPLIKPIFDAIGGSNAIVGKTIGVLSVSDIYGKVFDAKNDYISRVTLDEKNNSLLMTISGLDEQRSKNINIGPIMLIRMMADLSPLSEFMSGPKIDLNGANFQLDKNNNATKLVLDEDGQSKFITQLNELNKIGYRSSDKLSRSILSNIDKSTEFVDSVLLMSAHAQFNSGSNKMLDGTDIDPRIVNQYLRNFIDHTLGSIPSYALEQMFQRSKYKGLLYTNLFYNALSVDPGHFDYFGESDSSKLAALRVMASNPDLYKAAISKTGIVKNENGKIIYNQQVTGLVSDGTYKFTNFRKMAAAAILGAVATDDMVGLDYIAENIPSNLSKREKILGMLNVLSGFKVDDQGKTVYDNEKPVKNENAAININDPLKNEKDMRLQERLKKAISAVGTLYGDNDNLLTLIERNVTDSDAKKFLKHNVLSIAEMTDSNMKNATNEAFVAAKIDLGNGKNLVEMIANTINTTPEMAWKALFSTNSKSVDELVPLLKSGVLTKQEAAYLNNSGIRELQKAVVNQIVKDFAPSGSIQEIKNLVEKDFQTPPWADKILSDTLRSFLLSDVSIINKFPSETVMSMYQNGMFEDVDETDIFDNNTLKSIFLNYKKEVSKALTNADYEHVEILINDAKSEALKKLLRDHVERSFKTDDFIASIFTAPKTVKEMKPMLDVIKKALISPLNKYPEFMYLAKEGKISNIHQVFDEHGEPYQRLADYFGESGIKPIASKLKDNIDLLEMHPTIAELQDRLLQQQSGHVLSTALKQVMSEVVKRSDDQKLNRILNAAYILASGDATGNEIGTQLLLDINSGMSLRGYVTAKQLSELASLLDLNEKFEDENADVGIRRLFQILLLSDNDIVEKISNIAYSNDEENILWSSVEDGVKAALWNKSTEDARKKLMVTKLGPDKKPLRSENGSMIFEFDQNMDQKKLFSKLGLNDEQKKDFINYLNESVTPNMALSGNKQFEDQWHRLIANPESLNNLLMKTVANVPQDYLDELRHVEKMFNGSQKRDVAFAMLSLCNSLVQPNASDSLSGIGNFWPSRLNIKFAEYGKDKFSDEFMMEHVISDIDGLKQFVHRLNLSKEDSDAMLDAASMMSNPKDLSHGYGPWIRCEMLSVVDKRRLDNKKLEVNIERVLAVREIQNDALQSYSKQVYREMPEKGDIIGVYNPDVVLQRNQLIFDRNNGKQLTKEQNDIVSNLPEIVLVKVDKDEKNTFYQWNNRQIFLNVNERSNNAVEDEISPNEDISDTVLDISKYAYRKPSLYEQKVIDYLTNFMNVMYRNLIRSAMYLGVDKIYINPSWTMGMKPNASAAQPLVDTWLRDHFGLARQEMISQKIKKGDGFVDVKQPVLDKRYGTEIWDSTSSAQSIKDSYDNLAKRWGFALTNLDHHHKTDRRWGYTNEIFVKQVWMLDISGKNSMSQKMLKGLNRRMAFRIGQNNTVGASLAAFIETYFKVMHRDIEFRYNRSGEIIADAYLSWRHDPDNINWINNQVIMTQAKQYASNKIGVDITGIDDPNWKYRQIPEDFYNRMVQESSIVDQTDDKPDPSVLASQLDKLLEKIMPKMYIHPEYRSLPNEEIPIRVAKDILENSIELFPQKALREDSEYRDSVLRLVKTFNVSPEKELELLTKDFAESENDSVFVDDSSPAIALAADAFDYLIANGDSEENFANWADQLAPELHSNDELREEVVKILRERGMKLLPANAPSIDELNDMFRTEQKVDSVLKVGDSVLVEKTVSSDIRATALSAKRATGKIIAVLQIGCVLRFDNDYDERVLNRQRWLFAQTDLKRITNAQ